MASSEDGGTEGPETRPDAIDPQLAYPRGNRLGLRHPRPAVVVLLVLAVLVGGAYVVSRIGGDEDSQVCCVAPAPLDDAQS